MSEGDLLHRFMFEGLPIRGHFVCLDASWRATIEQHDYPALVAHALGEAVAATVLIAGSLKFEGRLSLQFQGPGPVHLMLAQCTDRHALRGVARYRGALPPSATLAELTGGGQLAVTVENEQRADRYQGVVPLDRGSLAQCLEDYFARSEQVPTRLVLAATADRSAGLLLQRVPAAGGGPCSPAEVQDAWQRIGLLAATLRQEELLAQPCRSILRRLFHGDDLRLFEGRPVFFQCSCSRQRVAGILRSLGETEVRGILDERGQVEVRCEFCNRAYLFDPIDAARLFLAAPPPGTAPGVH